MLEILPHSSLSKLKTETTICPQLLMIAISFHTWLLYHGVYWFIFVFFQLLHCMFFFIFFAMNAPFVFLMLAYNYDSVYSLKKTRISQATLLLILCAPDNLWKFVFLDFIFIFCCNKPLVNYLMSLFLWSFFYWLIPFRLVFYFYLFRLQTTSTSWSNHWFSSPAAWPSRVSHVTWFKMYLTLLRTFQWWVELPVLYFKRRMELWTVSQSTHCLSLTVSQSTHCLSLTVSQSTHCLSLTVSQSTHCLSLTVSQSTHCLSLTVSQSTHCLSLAVFQLLDLLAICH